MVVAVAELLLQLGLKFKESALDNLFLLRWTQLLGISYLPSFKIFLVVDWILNQVQVREECLLKSIKVDSRLLVIENIVFFDISLNLLTVEGNPILYDNAVHELFLCDVSLPCEVELIVGQLCVPVHCLELFSKPVPDLPSNELLGKTKKIGKKGKCTHFLWYGLSIYY
jgi:hypothetical protein